MHSQGGEREGALQEEMIIYTKEGLREQSMFGELKATVIWVEAKGAIESLEKREPEHRGLVCHPKEQVLH